MFIKVCSNSASRPYLDSYSALKYFTQMTKGVEGLAFLKLYTTASPELVELFGVWDMFGRNRVAKQLLMTAFGNSGSYGYFLEPFETSLESFVFLSYFF